MTLFRLEIDISEVLVIPRWPQALLAAWTRYDFRQSERAHHNI